LRERESERERERDSYPCTLIARIPTPPPLSHPRFVPGVARTGGTSLI
jgi:hypothetical protein